MKRMTELDLTVMRHGWTTFDANAAADRLAADRLKYAALRGAIAWRIAQFGAAVHRLADRAALAISGQVAR